MVEMTPEERLELVSRVVADRLSNIWGDWTAYGEVAIGPDGLAVRAFEDPGSEPRPETEAVLVHIDLGFYLNAENSESPIIFDCVTGTGETEDGAIAAAVERWATCTAPAVFELLAQNGKFAEHSHGDDELGLRGWHVIFEPIWSWGFGEAADRLTTWTVGNPLLPQLAATLAPSLRRD